MLQAKEAKGAVLKFSGLLTLVDVPSDCPPAGGRGHCVILTRDAVIDALPQLVGMEINCHLSWGKHLQPCPPGGFARIDKVKLVDHELLVSGIITDESIQLPAGLGMSYELRDCHVPDTLARIWRLTKVTFSGAAVLLADKAAYQRTWFKVEEN